MTDMNETEIIESQDSVLIKNNETNHLNDLTDRVKTIQKNLADNGAEVSAEEIEPRLRELVSVYKVPAAEAQRSVTNAFLKKYNISKPKTFGVKTAAVDKKVVDIAAMIGQPDTWVNFKGKVIQLWETNHESIAQAGLVADETGVVKFTLWANSGIELLEHNKTYDFKNVVVKSWNGKASAELNKAAAAVFSDEEIQTIRTNDGTSGEPRDKTNEIRTISELKRDGMWTDLKASIVQIFENTHESISCAGVLGDETGTMRFTVWKTADIETPEIEKSYLISNAIVKEWNGNYSLEINRAGKIEEIDETITAKPSVFEVCGCAVDIQAGSGLIRRCPECNKVMAKGMCSEHGKLKGKYDLRIKAVFDDGTQAYETIINCDLTEKLLRIQLEDAVAMAAETLDPECVNDIIKKEFIGHYYIVKGAKTDRYVIAENVEKVESVDIERAANLIEEIQNELKEREASSTKSKEFEEFEKLLETVDDLNLEDEIIVGNFDEEYIGDPAEEFVDELIEKLVESDDSEVI